MIIVFLLLLGLLAYQFNKEIRLNSIVLYVLAVILSALSILLPDKYIFSSILDGHLGLAFLTVSMLTGAMHKDCKLKFHLRNIRKEYTTLAFIFITPHVILNIYNALLGIGYFEIFGLLTFVFMIPLIISSFKNIKSTMRTSTWIRLHRIAYLVYLLLFIHLIVVSNTYESIIYCLIFGTYIFLKLYNYYFKTHRLLYSTVITLLTISSVFFVSFDSNEYNYKYSNILEDETFEDGTYFGSSDGYRNFETSVYVSIKNNKIINVTLIECGCTPYANNGFYLDSAYVISNNIVQLNRTDVDSVSGATATSISINEAVIDALTKAKK